MSSPFSLVQGSWCHLQFLSFRVTVSLGGRVQRMLSRGLCRVLVCAVCFLTSGMGRVCVFVVVCMCVCFSLPPPLSPSLSLSLPLAPSRSLRARVCAGTSTRLSPSTRARPHWRTCKGPPSSIQRPLRRARSLSLRGMQCRPKQCEQRQ